jgi:hypothetical protein
MDVYTMQNVGLTLPVQSQLSRFYVTKSDMTAPHKDCISFASNAFEDAKGSALSTVGAKYFNFKINTLGSPFPYTGQPKFLTVTVTIN